MPIMKKLNFYFLGWIVFNLIYILFRHFVPHFNLPLIWVKVDFLIGWLLAVFYFVKLFYNFNMLIKNQRLDIPKRYKDSEVILFINKFLTSEGISYKNNFLSSVVCFTSIILFLFLVSINP